MAAFGMVVYQVNGRLLDTHYMRAVENEQFYQVQFWDEAYVPEKLLDQSPSARTAGL